MPDEDPALAAARARQRELRQSEAATKQVTLKTPEQLEAEVRGLAQKALAAWVSRGYPDSVAIEFVRLTKLRRRAIPDGDVGGVVVAHFFIQRSWANPSSTDTYLLDVRGRLHLGRETERVPGGPGIVYRVTRGSDDVTLVGDVVLKGLNYLVEGSGGPATN